MEAEEVYLLKNLRGILYSRVSLDIAEELGLLRRVFKYRDIGIAESVANSLGIDVWKRLKVLPDLAADHAESSLRLASHYATPLLVLREEALSDLPIVAKLATKEKLSLREFRRNLRLVSYAITDFYVTAVREVDKGRRRRLAEKDMKRYWRVPASESGRVIVAYADPLELGEQPERCRSLVPCLVVERELLELKL